MTFSLSHSFSSYVNPMPSPQSLGDGRDALEASLFFTGACQIKKHDAYNRLLLPWYFIFWFEERGTQSQDRGHILLEKHDFDLYHVSDYWYQGMACKLTFVFILSPIKNTLVGNSICSLPRNSPAELIKFVILQSSMHPFKKIIS